MFLSNFVPMLVEPLISIGNGIPSAEFHVVNTHITVKAIG